MYALSKLGLALSLAVHFKKAFAGPCDIYASGNTPCVAAHSTTRALYNSFKGPLYQIQRTVDGTTTDISPLSAGGVANAAAQDSFCTGSVCLISIIYDQSGRGNHLYQAPAGGNAPGPDDLAAANGAPVTLNGKKAYGVFIAPGTGYRIDDTNGVPTGDQSQGLYAVFDGTHYNDGCCFDYGNAETSNDDTGNGHMEAIYFGTNTVWDKGNGAGPWIMADLENGLYSSNAEYGENTNDPTITYRFLTAAVKGEANNWAIRGANAQSGTLSTFYSGARPSGYNPMHKEGSLILGIGGDNSKGAQGTFYEGCVTSGFPSDSTENAVQSNVIAAKYATTSLATGPAINVGSTVSFKVTTTGYNTRFIAHNGTQVITEVVTSSSPTSLKQQASWKVVSGLATNAGCISFQSVDTPANYLRHANFELYSEPSDGSEQFAEDATFCAEAGLNGAYNSIRSWGYPARYVRHFQNVGYIAADGGPLAWDGQGVYNNDTTFDVLPGFA